MQAEAAQLEDVQQQLAELRRRIARIDRKYGRPTPAPPSQRSGKPPREAVEELLSGEIVRTRRGCHFETERVWERHRRHGSVGIADLCTLAPDLLSAISGGEISGAMPEKWAFLDTETTGLGGGACAFLVGVGSIDGAGFRLRQFFMRNYAEEPSLLWRLREYLAQFDALITYNGRVFDQPLLEGRYRVWRMAHPFRKLPHLDVLFGARRLWKLRLASCRLVDLETEILGVERQGDLPGELIPYFYYEFQRTLQALKLVPIFHHNALDILTLACLTAVVAAAYQSPLEAALHHGADIVGLARWLRENGRAADGLQMLRRAVEMGLPDPLLFRTLWDIAREERRGGDFEAAAALWRDLADCRNEYRVKALVELSKHFERRRKDTSAALEFVERALSLEATAPLENRVERLRRKLSSGPRQSRVRRTSL